jgi:O-antigen ligase
MSKRKIQQRTTAAAASKKSLPKQASPGLIGWLVILAIILPITFSNTTLDPSVSPRYLILCIFITLFFAYYLFFKSKTYPLPFSHLLSIVFGVGLLYCIASTVSLALAINPKEGFMQMSRNYMNLFFLAIVLCVVYYDGNRLIALFRTFVVLAFVHSIIGILQYYGMAFTDLPGNFTPYGLMANRNLYGSAQTLLLPFCLFVLYTDRKEWKYASGLSLLFLFTSILLSQTRSAWLASLLIIFGSLVLVLVFVPRHRKTWAIGTGIITLAIAVLVFAFLYGGGDNNLSRSIKERSSTLVRSVTGSDTSVAASNINERFVIWQKTMQLIKDHKLTGVGPGNWKIGIQKYGNKGLINEYGDYVLDHTHNIYLQLAAETGIPGLLLFLTFWILIVYAGVRSLARKDSSDNQKLFVLLSLCGIGAFALDGFFSFPLERIEHSFYLFLFGGIVLAHFALGLKREQVFTLSNRNWLWVPLALSAFGLFISNERYQFEVHAYRMKAFYKMKDYQEVISEVEESRTNFGTLDINADPLQMYSAIAYKELKKYDLALKECQTALLYHPYNARVYNTMGTIYTETQDFAKAIDAYKKALSIIPRSDVSLKNLAINYFYVKQYGQCLETLEKIKDVEKVPMLVQIRNVCLQQVNQK